MADAPRELRRFPSSSTGACASQIERLVDFADAKDLEVFDRGDHLQPSHEVDPGQFADALRRLWSL